MSTAIIIQCKPNPYFNQKRTIFGYYAMVYIGKNNTMKLRSVPLIALSDSNEHGENFSMNLYTSKGFHSYEW